MEIITADKSNFEQLIKGDKPVLVDFWASWCAPCKRLAPVIEELAGEFSNRCQFAKLNVDENLSLATRYGVMSLPTLILFKDGRPQQQWVGFRTKQELKELLEEALGD